MLNSSKSSRLPLNFEGGANWNGRLEVKLIPPAPVVVDEVGAVPEVAEENILYLEAFLNVAIVRYEVLCGELIDEERSASLP